MKDYIKKICMCGDSSVGKTSLIRRFVKGKYDEKYITTLGTVISKKLLQYPEKSFNVNMQIWDISGQSEFKRIQKSAFRHADGAIAVCDVTRPQTAFNLYEWIKNFHNVTKLKVPVIVLVNKFDLIGKNEMRLKRVKQVLDNLNCPIYPSSAKTGHNVELGFKTLSLGTVAGLPILKPITAVELVSMPEIFENPYSFLDYVLDRFTTAFGDEELSIHMIRNQVESRGNEFNRIPKEEAMNMVNHLIELINNFRTADEAMELRMEFMEAYKRCQW